MMTNNMTTKTMADADGFFPAAAVAEFDPNRTEFFWDDDFSKFRPVRLRWWDDASYARYQAGCDDECEAEAVEAEAAEVGAATMTLALAEDDELPF